MSEREDLSAMTVNERLLARDLMDEFDEAMSNNDVGTLRRIFTLIELLDYDFAQLGVKS